MKTKKHTSRINSSSNNKYNNKHNSNIIHILTLVKDYYKEQNDKFRIKTYERAIYQIKHWNKSITKGSELSHLEGIGKGMIEKIDTIISSGTLPIIKEKHIKNKYTKDNKYTKKKNHNTNEVTSILGFNKIFINDIKKKHGARTINDFRKYLNSGSGSGRGRGSKSNNNKSDLKLTHIQQLGLKYYEDLQDLIPRDEITYLGNLLKKEIEHNDNSNGNKYTMMLSGSYPSHSKEYSKDIDIIIIRNKEEPYSGELKDIIEKIGNDKYKDKNNMMLETISLGEKKFMGLLHSSKTNKMRHIDIRFVNLEELPYTWFYYSSGQIFNKLIRDKLKKKGYKLNEYGLYKSNSKDKKYNKYDKVNIDMNLEYDLLSYIENVEKQIFKYADMEYKTVKERY
jgi:DNA polymerase/3'-5' exonuclease PolX